MPWLAAEVARAFGRAELRLPTILGQMAQASTIAAPQVGSLGSSLGLLRSLELAPVVPHGCDELFNAVGPGDLLELSYEILSVGVVHIVHGEAARVMEDSLSRMRDMLFELVEAPSWIRGVP